MILIFRKRHAGSAVQLLGCVIRRVRCGGQAPSNRRPLTRLAHLASNPPGYCLPNGLSEYVQRSGKESVSPYVPRTGKLFKLPVVIPNSGLARTLYDSFEGAIARPVCRDTLNPTSDHRRAHGGERDRAIAERMVSSRDSRRRAEFNAI